MTLSLPMILLTAFAAALCVVLAVWGLHLLTKKSEVADEEFIPTRPKKKQTDDTFVLHRITELIGKPFASTVAESLPQDWKDGIHRRIEAAGFSNGLTVERYIQRKVGEVITYGSIALFFYTNGSTILSLVSLGFIGLTDIQLHSTSQKRQDEIQRQLPDFLDVLAVTVGAGLAFRQALSRVADSMPGVLADEFRIALRQMDLGTSRRDAFIEMRRRNSNEALGKFVSALQQSEELGAPLTDALQAVSQDMRREDAQYLRRRAQRLNPRVTGITAATMLPGLILVIGGSMIIGSTPNIDMGSLFGG
ncbi:type II secretion system F family protein [Halostreptopolyspora alba]|uniref:Type II secretion system F family protein n=1 Tax=Halostreptopolyspora alba TaxID=2487137 RepID=A0A3N0E6L9_9ACTN|nr:type II secretion system F family protein [Nocardiopsaceae bacterium YIM 96095]